MTDKVEHKAPRHWLTDAIGGAWKLAKVGMNRPTAEDAELAGLVAPHFAILLHKRAKYLGDNPDRGRWRSELHQFVARTVLPYLDEDPALHGLSAEGLAEKVDAIVAEEQRRAESAPASLPATSRFEDSWAT